MLAERRWVPMRQVLDHGVTPRCRCGDRPPLDDRLLGSPIVDSNSEWVIATVITMVGLLIFFLTLALWRSRRRGRL